MDKNLSSADRIIRLIMAGAIIAAYYLGYIQGKMMLVFGFFAAVLILTALLGWCGLYAIFRVKSKSCQTEPPKQS